MSRLGARCASLAAGLLLAGCASTPPEVVPASPSPPPSPPAWPGLMAALARVDITPPPGPGLAGGGPEGRPAAGYRARLHARALVLQDQRGEAVVFVVADLPFVSVILHRRVAELVRARAPIGADRLLLAATHTHSGPGHFLDAESYNRHGSSVPGYDPAIVSFLAQRIASAVLRAWDQRSPARVAWGTTSVRGVTRNRSVAAGGVSPDPTLLMLRVDRRSEAEAVYRPAGALSIFAIHGTGNSPENDLWDADIQGRVARLLEAHVDSLNRRPAGPDRAAVHLFANGAEGDVSPVWSAASRCAPPSLRRTRMRGSRGARAWEWVGVDASARDACLAAARDGLDMTSRAIAGRAAALFDSLALRPASAPPLVSRAFMTLPLTGPAAPTALCPEAEPGAATVGGAEDVPTRYHRWRFLGLIRSAFEEGPRAARPRARGCQAEKRRALAGGLRRLTGIGRGFPEVAQLAVVRIGGLVVAALPAEATTAAGIALTDSVRAALGAQAEHVAILGLANGFIQYVATSAEYRAQHYEGASTLYGPGTAAALGGALAGLARDLGPAAAPSPPALVHSLILAPGPRRRVRPVADTQAVKRRLIRLVCAADGITAQWEDAEPGALDVSAQFLVRIERLRAAGVDTVARDDGAIEVRSLGRGRARTGRWGMWWPNTEPGRYRVVIPGRPYAEELAGDCATTRPANRAPRPGTR